MVSCKTIDPTWTIHLADVRAQLDELPARSAHCVVTSPPYMGLRDYNVKGQIGSEDSWQEHIHVLNGVFNQVKRVLRSDGVLWLNYGDMYAQGAGRKATPQEQQAQLERANAKGYSTGVYNGYKGWERATGTAGGGLKPKDLMGMPWRVAFALQESGWWLRSDSIWSKANPQPCSVVDRPTPAHEYVFLLSKSARYFYDREAVRVPLATIEKRQSRIVYNGKSERTSTFMPPNPSGRNLWTVQHAVDAGAQPPDAKMMEALWRFFLDAYLQDPQEDLWTTWEMTCQSFRHAHYATFPEALAETCIRAGTSEHGCCAACGACWVRVLEPTPHYAERLGKCYADPDKKAIGVANGVPPRMDGPLYQTTGWKPACECGTAERVPCTVLDPFSGSGTTGLVALREGRSYVGIELNPEYHQMSCDRLRAFVSGVPYGQYLSGVRGLFADE